MSLNRAQQYGLDLHQLDRSRRQPNASNKYLAGGQNSQFIFLYHATTSNNAVQVFATFYPNGNCRLHIIDPAVRRQAIPSLAETYAIFLEKQREVYGTSTSVAYPERLGFETIYHSNDITALKAISRELGLMEDKSYTLVLSSARDISYFERLVPKLSKFPVLTMSPAKNAHLLQGLPWQTNAALKLVKRYLSLGPWVDRMIALAEYYDVPIGHIEGDTPLFLADISFARRLVQQDTVLWWSPSDQPDLGGLENDIASFEELPRTDFVSPGVYTNVCLEVAVRNLAVNSVLQSVLVNELEGSGGTTAFDSVSHTIDEYKNGDSQRDITFGGSQVSSQTFSILKNLLKGWLLDKIQDEGQSPATLVIDHFWRWITSKASQLYDPSLHRFIHSLMRKTFIQLLAEFKRLGSHVVYADFSTILLATSKPPGTAHAYATYITTAVTSHELFQHIYLNTNKFYDFLVYMDRANMGGVVCEDPLAVEPPAELSMEMPWNICNFLPPAIHKDFNNVVQYFIIEMMAIKKKVNEMKRVPLRPIQPEGPEGTQQVDATKSAEGTMVVEFIARKLTRKMLRTVGSIFERQQDDVMNPDSDGSFEFPTLPGGHLHMTNPALEFVKFTCAVFSLAKDYRVEIGLLKRSLLELIGVKEFANEAAYRNPCEPLKLPNVPCRHCDVLRDFDFCRDQDLLPSNLDASQRWTCANCGGEYDKVAIEFALIDMVRSLERRFARQDLRCGKCQQIHADNVSKYCGCSGAYQLTLNKADARKTLKTIVNVAISHKLMRLKVSSCSWVG